MASRGKAVPAKKKAKAAPEPDTLAGILVDYETVDQQVDALEAKVRKLKADRDAIEKRIFEHMRAQGIDGFKGDHTNVAVVTQRVPKVTDWDAFNAYVLKHKALDLLHRRVSSTAYFDRVNNGEPVPGVVPESFMKLQFSKRKA